ncbi:MAG: NB-ARC domain-containing protein [Cyanobacteriota bacterium]|nr:NB-ARC domain-containing protein [Cyanobacteriota bacterium]
MNFEEALKIVESRVFAARGEHLSDLEKAILQASWENHTYKEALTTLKYQYEEGHIKNEASRLWKLLSEVLGREVKKKTFCAALSKYSLSAQVAQSQGREQQCEQLVATPYQDWGTAPPVSYCYGRDRELDTLERWISWDKCRLILLLGQGGIGKTTLSIQLIEKIQNKFDYIIWRSLEASPAIDKILADAVKLFSNQEETLLPDTLNEQIAKLIHYLQSSHCLLILDNAESILQSGSHLGQYRKGYEEYGELLKQIAQSPHQSCLVLTSREKPKSIEFISKKIKTIQCLPVDGLSIKEGQKIFTEYGEFIGSEEELQFIIEHYAGNPSALEVVAAGIQEALSGNLSQFVENYLKLGHFNFQQISDVLERQFGRLSSSEKQVMYWLCINYEPVSDSTLQDDLTFWEAKQELLESIASLSRRSLIKNTLLGRTQLPVWREYVINRLINEICQEIETQQISLLNSCALCKATSKDYIRETQVRLILQPLLERLLQKLGGKIRVESKLKEVILNWQRQFPLSPGYLGGNILAILIQLGIDLRDYNFSRLAIGQAYLDGIQLHQVDFSNSEISKSYFSKLLGSVLCVAFSADGQFWATGDADKKIDIWRVADGQPIATCIGHTNWVRSVAFHPQKNLLASGSNDSTVRLWKLDSEECECIATLEGHTDQVWSVAFSPDGKMLASASADTTVRLWDVDSHQCLHVLREHKFWVVAIAFNKRGTILASGSADQTVKLWDVETARCCTTWQQLSHQVRSIAFSPDGEILASGSDDTRVRLSDLHTGECLKSFSGHSGRVWSVAFSPDGKTLASGSSDGTVKLWNLETESLLLTLPERDRRVRSLAFSPDSKMLISGSDDQSVRLWDVSRGEPLRTIYGYTQRVWSVAFSADGKTLVSGSDDRAVRLWDIQTGSCRTLGVAKKRVRSVAVHPQSIQIASGGNDGRVQLWNVVTGNCLTLSEKHRDWISVVAFNTDGTQLASAGDDNRIKVWDVRTNQCLKTYEHPDWIRSLVISPDGQDIAIGSDATKVRIWNINTEQLTDLGEHQNRVRSVAWSSDGKLIASGSDDLTVKVWHISTGNCLHSLEEHTNQIRSVVFSPDGQILASAGDDCMIKLWEVETGRCLRTLTGHANRIRSVVFSPDGLRLASGSEDETIKLWNVETGALTNTFRAERLYEGMNITGTTGISNTQKATLKALGAVEIG